MYALIENGSVVQYPYSLAQLQKANPNVSFVLNNDEAYEAFGMFRVYTSQLPVYSAASQKLSEGVPTFNTDVQRWLQSWQVVDLTPEEIESNFAAQAATVRSDRNQRLKDSDWTQVADAPVDKAAWATYRQALRDISTQTGFPWGIQWPAQPE